MPFVFVCIILACAPSYQQSTDSSSFHNLNQKTFAIEERLNRIDRIVQNLANKFETLASKVTQIESSLPKSNNNAIEAYKTPNKARL